jgi:hypothetical protein
MKTLIYAALVAGALATPAPVTRAEVQADLVRVEQAGYHPTTKNVHYPADIQVAEARLTAQDVTTHGDTSVGGASSGFSQTGAPTPAAGTRSIYYGH